MLTDREQLVERTKYLQAVLNENRTDPSLTPPGYEKKNKDAAWKDMIDCNEVYPGIIIGNGSTAKNKKYLKKIGVTHVLNTAMGDAFGMINTDAKFYKSENIQFLGIHAMDLPGMKISIYFEQVVEFIDSGLASKGKVFVHCLMGRSRSSTCVLAFLMMKRGMTAEEAIRAVLSKRFIHPNEGFLLQLAALDIRLQERRALIQPDEPSPDTSGAHTRCDLG